MSHTRENQTKIWYEVEWLPGYVAYHHKSKNRSVQKSLLGLRKKLNTETGNENNEAPVSFPILETPHFTILKNSDFKMLTKKKEGKAFFLSQNQSLSEKHQAKLAFEINKKNLAQCSPELSMAWGELKKLNLFLNQLNKFEKKYSSEEMTFSKKKKKRLSTFSIPRLFHYFGNSINYIEGIDRVLSSSNFAEAQTIKDITCGSCVLTFYLAKKYPNKKYIASDINGEIINILNYIKNTSQERIETEYSSFHKKVFESSNPEEKFNELVQHYNADMEKDYCLLMFLQNNAFTNIQFRTDGSIKVHFKRERPVKLETWLGHIDECKNILEKTHIEFQTMEMQDAINKAQPGDFYFLTPPHEHDQAKLYSSYIDKNSMQQALSHLSAKQVSYLITYGDNTTNEATDLRKHQALYRFSYIVPGGMLKHPKKLSLYVSLDAIPDAQKLEELKLHFYLLAQKIKKVTEKKLVNLKQQKNDEALANDIEIEEENIKLASQIMNDMPPISITESLKVETDEEPLSNDNAPVMKTETSPVNFSPLEFVKGLFQNSIFAIEQQFKRIESGLNTLDGKINSVKHKHDQLLMDNQHEDAHGPIIKRSRGNP